MEDELKLLGLNHYESKALSLLLSSKLTLRELSDKAKIPFGKIYSIVKSLKEKNLVSETNSRPKLIYIGNASDVIGHLIDIKKKKDSELFQKLQEKATTVDAFKGRKTKFFQVGTTVEDNKEIQLRSFNESTKEVLQILNIHHKPASNRKSKTLWEKSICEAVKRGVVFKAIYPSNAVLPTILLQLHKRNPEKFQIRRLNTDFARCDIIDGNKVLVKLVHQDALQFGGVFFIDNESIAENLTKIFYEMWEQAANENIEAVA